MKNYSLVLGEPGSPGTKGLKGLTESYVLPSQLK